MKLQRRYIFVFLGFLITVMLFYVLKPHKRMDTITNITIGNESFGVINDPKAAEGAEILYNIRTRLNELVKHMINIYPYNPKVARMVERIADTVFEESNSRTNFSTFMQNKGDKIVLCIRNSKNEFIDNNTLMFVAIHELAHVYNTSYGHDASFWSGMKLLLTEASKIGIYTPVDYSKNPVQYCNEKMINDSPLFQSEIM
jgi:hypothetical protein